MRSHSLFVLIPAAVLWSGAPVLAQSGPSCASGAWTGSVTYSRTLQVDDEKTVERVSNRGLDYKQSRLYYEFKANVAVLEDPDSEDDGSIGRATVTHQQTFNETASSTEKNSCDQGKTWQTMSGNFTKQSSISGNGSGDANVSVGMNDDGTYSVSVSVPRIKAQRSASESATYSGQCRPKEGKTTTMPPTQVEVEGGALSSSGRDRVNPSSPNRISGSYAVTNVNVTERMTWNLEKCGAPLRLIAIEFEDMKFPNWNQWQSIAEERGTIDGNLVKIKARVLNASAEQKSAEVVFKETYRGDKWDGAKPDKALGDTALSVSVGPGETKDVEMLWDSSGYAWYDDGRPRLVQRIKAELKERNRVVNQMVQNLKVAPKPLVLVHGLWSNWTVFESWQNILTTSHSYDWKAFPVGEVTSRGIINTGRDVFSSEQTNTMPDNAAVLGRYITYAQENRNAWHVDVVAHSVGGLIGRYYINALMPAPYQDGRPQVSHLLMLATPNMGTPCADVMDIAFRLTGKTPYVIQDIRQDDMAQFNRRFPQSRGVKLASLAGDALPNMCKTIVPNDGFVPVPSAHWTIADRVTQTRLHTDMIGTETFSTFIRPRLGIGPSGNHAPAAPNLGSDNSWGQGEARFMNASYQLAAAPAPKEALKPDFAKAVTLTAKQAVDVDIPVKQAVNVGITFMAASDVSATLFDDKGAVVGRNLTKTAEANATFRSIVIDKPVGAGTWKLRLENTAAQPREAVIAAWQNTTRPGNLVAQR
ncbi:esterase/lipase family protein [Steroidobacter flavus]|uniref:Esterase/lipase family protein n=1 Tax=Steroidobacter flavus TaxID=1842136 RepID=A0ABV8T1D6_9GAMM